jgi:hypothetical protein
MTAPDRPVPFWKRPIRPAVALWFIAPIIGELVSGSAPLNEYISPFSILMLGMLYGSGAILIREFTVRLRKGWLSLLLLGLAYGIYEEGLVVRSFFDPNWVDLDNLGVYGRVAGVNWVWTEHLMIFHAVISIMASITMAHILFPARRSEPWVGTRGLTWNLFAFFAMLPIGALLNAYDAPDAWLGASWLVIVLLVIAAWRAQSSLIPARPTALPRPRRLWWIGLLGTFGHIFITYFTAEKGSPHFMVSMLIVALFDLSALWLILHSTANASAWDDRHRFALIAGALSVFLILGPLTTNGQYPVMWFSNPVLLLLGWWIYRRVGRAVSAGAFSPSARPGD